MRSSRRTVTLKKRRSIDGWANPKETTNLFSMREGFRVFMFNIIVYDSDSVGTRGACCVRWGPPINRSISRSIKKDTDICRPPR